MPAAAPDKQERDEGRDLVDLNEPAGGDAERPGCLQ
jgi:hypothetical protein